MKKLIYLLLIISLSGVAQAQNVEKKDYYVSTISTSLYDSTSTELKPITTLHKHHNVKVVKVVNAKWVQIEYVRKLRYGLAKDFKPGKAIVSNYSVRTGARCKDGSYSSATGRGACSHHGGVRNWITSSKQRVRIIN